MEKKQRSIASLINELPKKYRGKAFSLFRYIVRNHNISWDNDKVFKYKNKLVPNSNILHLVLHALLRKIKDKPAGMKLFYQGLREANVPEYLVANEIGKLIITGREIENKAPGKKLVKK